MTEKFPVEERFGLTDQIRRASVSISLNIAEGSGCGSNVEFVRFLRIAQRSAYEVIAALEITLRLGLSETKIISEANSRIDELAAMISGLITKLKSDRLTV